ncbi:tyrosine-type recombinase/integrase [Ligilactobacillus equi]|uniref:tyrosine-type recombinase/integrase n=1 Tax=Ligilactobacillus equi TaxID=137357 RepID=UPI0039BC7154
MIDQGFHTHNLRHTHVAYSLSCGVDIYTISNHLGHADMKTTTRYYAYIIQEYQERQNHIVTDSLNKLTTKNQ